MEISDPNPYVGLWLCRYWWTGSGHDDEEVSEYYVQACRRGRELVLESLPNKEDSYLVIRLCVDGNTVTGNWEENTSPTGAFSGAIYSGAIQLQTDKSGQRMEGQWAGVGHDYELKRASIYTGRWEMERVEEVPAEAEQYQLSAAMA